ncbi:hypothetical protein SLS54_009733 [Diplodia seriata]
MSAGWTSSANSLTLNYINKLEIASLVTAYKRKHWSILLVLTVGFLTGASVAIANVLTYTDSSAVITTDGQLLKTSTFSFENAFESPNGTVSIPRGNSSHQPFAAVIAERQPGGQFAPWTKDEHCFESFGLLPHLASNDPIIEATVSSISVNFNCEDLPVVQCPGSDKQITGTIGGPTKRDRYGIPDGSVRVNIPSGRVINYTMLSDPVPIDLPMSMEAMWIYLNNPADTRFQFSSIVRGEPSLISGTIKADMQTVLAISGNLLRFSGNDLFLEQLTNSRPIEAVGLYFNNTGLFRNDVQTLGTQILVQVINALGRKDEAQQITGSAIIEEPRLFIQLTALRTLQPGIEMKDFSMVTSTSTDQVTEDPVAHEPLGWRPLVLRVWAKWSTVGVLCAAIIAVAILQCFSIKRTGFANSNSTTQATLGYSVIVALLILSYLCSGIDSSVKSLSSYNNFQSLSKRQLLLLGPKESLTFWVPFASTGMKSGIAVIASSMTLLLFPAIKVVAAGLFAHVQVLTTRENVVTTINTSWIGSIEQISGDATHLWNPKFQAAQFTQWTITPSSNVDQTPGIIDSLVLSESVGFDNQPGNVSTLGYELQVHGQFTHLDLELILDFSPNIWIRDDMNSTTLWPTFGGSSSPFQLLAAFAEYKYHNLTSLLDPAQLARISEDMLTAYTAQLLVQYRLYLSDAANSSSASSRVQGVMLKHHVRIAQDLKTTIILEALLTLVLLCVIWVFLHFTGDAILPREPDSIAARLSLLAGSRLVQRLRDEGVRRTADTDIWDEPTRLGWWKVRDHSGRVRRPTRWRWGIDIGTDFYPSKWNQPPDDAASGIDNTEIGSEHGERMVGDETRHLTEERAGETLETQSLPLFGEDVLGDGQIDGLQWGDDSATLKRRTL